MYKVIIINGTEEITIHYSTPDNSAPHVKELPLQESLSEIYTLKFHIYPNNPGYDKLFELTTRIKVIDLRDDSVRFTGRVSDIEESMDGMSLYKEVNCESALTYLNDTKMRNEVLVGDLPTMLTTILNKHNSKVDSSKQIQLGIVTAISNTAYQCDYKTTLATITDMKSKNSIDGDIRIRESNGVLYLDWLISFTDKVVPLQLGKNIQKMILDKNMDDFGTRIIPLGANNLTIESVNGGLDYIEESVSKVLYGVIEKIVSYSDITDAQELKDYCISDLSNYTQPQLTLKSTANDLSFLTGNKSEEFELGATLHIQNPLMNIDANYKIVQTSLDLLQPYNPDIIISSSPNTFASTINDIRNTSISNNGVYNGVQVGDSFGIRVSSNDDKTVITINALEGISIIDVVNNLKKFFIDTSGNLTMDGIQQITKNGKVIIENTENEYGGINNIYDISGNLVFKLGVESGTSSNVGATLIGYNKGSNKPRFKLGIAKDGDFGVLQLLNSNGEVKAVINGDDNNGNGVVFIVDSNEIERKLTTESYVNSAISDAIDAHVSAYHSAP